jgi:hypothetical protein
VQATCLTLTIMTIYRCNLVLKNKQKRHQSSNRKENLKVISKTALIWFIAVVISCPDLVYYSTIEIVLDENFSIKQCRQTDNTSNWIKYSNIITVITAYALPLTIITFYYARLLAYLASNQARLVINCKDKFDFN